MLVRCDSWFSGFAFASGFRMTTGSEIQIQSEEPTGWRCQAWRGAGTLGKVWLVIGSDGRTQADVAALRLALEAQLVQIDRTLKQLIMPCPALGGGSVSPPPAQCQRPFGPDAKVVQIVVSRSGAWALGATSPLNGATLLPVVQSTGNPAGLGAPWDRLNAARFDSDVAEVVWDVLRTAELAESDSRVFISYKRSEERQLAEQLYDGLGRHGFEVFLDAFEIDPGADFLTRLKQELSEKAMVLVLETPGLASSAWVQMEVQFAQLHRMGVLALHLPAGYHVPGIPPESRLDASTLGLLGGPSTYSLPPAGIGDLMGWLQSEHQKAVLRRRRLLSRSLRFLLHRERVGVSTHSGSSVIEANSAQTPSVDYLLEVVERQPRAPTYRRHHGDIVTRNPHPRGVLIGPVADSEAARRDLLDWLAQVAESQNVDEGHMLLAVRAVKAGAL